MYKAFREGNGTRDMAGAKGKTTEGFVAAVKANLDVYMAAPGMPEVFVDGVVKPESTHEADISKMREIFNKYDTNGDDDICFAEFAEMMEDLGVAPKTDKAVQKMIRRKANLGNRVGDMKAKV